ncbi:hypothetical protein SH2C18_38740 [Clostridium sediminicola]|uniref:hypothetical protein n=1 Tax=Clostridium sediminicola TaxID=3114879 RepID=UPI0031F2747E
MIDKFNNENFLYNSFFGKKCDCDNSCDYNKRSDCMTSKKICYCPCEFCKTVNTRPINLNKCTSRLLKVRVTLNNVCFNKEVSISVLLCDHCGKIVDFKTFTTILHKDCCSCCDKYCGTLRRKVSFILPKTNACDPLNLTAYVVANYTSPCKDDKCYC